jgi:TIR domain-containing protein/uncharacterized protein DUF2628
MAGHVFISHGSENRDEAAELCALIESRGVKAWMAPRDVRPGYDYSEELQAAIEGCGAFVVLVTEMANTSPYVRAETEMAFSNSKPIFPVRLSDIKPAAGLAFFLKIRHWTDAYGKGREASLDRLALELQRLCGAAPADAAPAPPAPIPAPPAPIPAPPAPTPPPPAPAPSPAADEELVRAAIGPNADWYLARWRRMDEKGSAISWSWAACMLSVFWLAYRKMWLWLVLFVVANVALAIVGSFSPMLARVTLFATIGLTFLSGYFGLGWYRRQVHALVGGAAGLDREAALARVRARGGISKPALIVSIALAGLLVLLVAAAALLQAQQQSRQEQLREQHLRAHENAMRDAVPAEPEQPAGDEQPAAEDQSGL